MRVLNLHVAPDRTVDRSRLPLRTMRSQSLTCYALCGVIQTYRKGPGEKIPDWGVLEASIYGTDVSRQMMRISMMNLVLHGIGKARLKRANVLSEMGGLTEEDLNRKYKVILSNPPFAGMLPKESIRHDLPTNSKKSELLFLGLMMESLAPGGRCAIVLPEGALSGSTSAHIELRKKLIAEFEVLAVISLPAGAFKPYTPTKTSVIIFRRPANPPENGKPVTNKVWFYEIKNDGYDPDKIQGGGRPETPEQNDIPVMLTAWKAYKAIKFTQPPGEEAGTVLKPGTPDPRCWWADYERIVDSDANLTASSYKPTVGGDVSDVDPAELVREVLGLEKQIVGGLEKLLLEVESV